MAATFETRKSYPGVRRLKGSKYWSFRFRYKGKDYPKSGFLTAEEAFNAKVQAQQEMKRQGFSTVFCDKTVDEVYKEFLKDKSPRRAYSTVVKYESLYKHHIQPIFGNREIKAITQNDVMSFFIKLDERQPDKKYGTMRQYSNQFIDGIRKLLANIFSQALGSNYICKSPMKEIKKEFFADLGVPKEEGQYIEPELISLINGEFKNNFRYTAFMLGYYAGLRLSEVGGLLWTDIDFANKEIHIERQMIKVDGKWCFAALKTKAAKRTIEMGDELYVYLHSLKVQQDNNMAKYGELYIRDNRIYKLYEDKTIKRINDYVPLLNVKANGEMLTSNIGKDLCSEIRKRFKLCYSDVPNIEKVLKISFHDFRHTHATMCADKRMPPDLLKKRLGHEKIETTYAYYRHETESSKKAERDTINKIEIMDFEAVKSEIEANAYFEREFAFDNVFPSLNQPTVTSEQILGSKLSAKGFYDEAV